MAIDFYELGRKTGAKTAEGQKSNFEALTGGLVNTVDSMIKASQLKTAALQAAMPQGIAIDKVPEELRAQATEFLTANKKAYTDASKVLASGINPQSQRYRNAIETINGVNTKFENLSTSLEGVALKRKAALDDPDGYSPSTSKEDRLTWGNLSNGDLYSNMTFNDDGTVNYTNSKGESKSFADFNVTPQSFEGQNTFLALNDKFTSAKYSGKSNQWSMHAGEAEVTVNALFQKLKPAGQKDMMMGDIDYLEKTTGFKSGTDEYENAINGILENPNDAIAGYKQHMLKTLENNYNKQTGPKGKEEGKGAGGFTGSQLPGQGYVSAETKAENRLKIDNRSTYGDYDGYYGNYTYRPDTDDYTIGEGDDMEVLTPFEVSKREGVARPNETAKGFKQVSKPKVLFGTDETFFQQTEEEFITKLEQNYDMSSYIVGESPDGILPGIFTDDPYERVTISDADGNALFSFRTDIDNPAKRVAEAKRFKKWLEDNNIEPKSTMPLPA
tara:strand:- start:1146 stop:2645 length:1500 start_codon:yes stop_codon:yes gene_type:complete